MAYVAIVPNEQFAGQVYGVQFHKGRAIVAEQTVDTSLGRTAEEVARLLKVDFHFAVLPMDAAPDQVLAAAATLPPAPKRDAPVGEGKYKAEKK